ncbi:hypothetical protein CEUSTIGMA_g11551.t1 [Chlamydomonas eustigma]|uniref:Uncharacterized protein n=1 Tax=Chlamydomonas eustigma TaxID=1157962 RepID=A0A250XM35_9CHLO|nr:hypothetical protein CEUSTIGMA_g11551.t1 [Chlamydomonas eustigma]|eukprot:GAX84128.1 hypothetical protein CEUSTIGMA_g11551.t1 [Chlamydomonas eustigma]
MLCAVSQLKPVFQVTLSDIQGVTLHGRPVALPPGKSYTVSAHILSDHIGVFRTVVVLDFGPHGMIGRGLTIRYERDENSGGAPPLPDIRPKEPFKPRAERMKVVRSADVEEGVPPPSSGFKFIRRPYGSYKPPAKLMDLFDAGRANGSLASLLPREPIQNIPAYIEKMVTLLHIEELQHELEVRMYDMQEAELKGNRGQYLSLEVAGLAEGRPSVLKGDAIFVRPATSLEGSKECKGYVHAVQKETIDLKFSPRFHGSWIQGSKYHVRFGINRSSFYFMQDALHRIAPSYHSTGPHQALILPSLYTGAVTPINDHDMFHVNSMQFKELHPSPPLPAVPVNQVGGCSFPNAAQQAAISAVLSPSTSPLPRVIFGPPGTGKTSTLVEAIIQVLRTQPDARVLACAPSNSAADLLASRVLQSRPPSEMLRLVAYSRPKEDMPVKLFNSGVTNWDHQANAFAMPSEADLRRPKTRIIVCTCLMAAKLWCAGAPEGFFSHIFVDEAGHAEEPLLMCAWLGTPAPQEAPGWFWQVIPCNLGPSFCHASQERKAWAAAPWSALCLLNQLTQWGQLLVKVRMQSSNQWALTSPS